MPLFLAKFLASSAAAARSSFLRKTRLYGTSTSSSSSGHYQSTTIMLPLMKLGTLAIRTISKPIAARLKTHASVHPRFRAAIIWMAQTKYRWATQLQRRVHGRAVNVAIRPLDEAKAIAAATDFLGELVIFTVAGLGIMYEVNRSYKSEAKKEAKRKEELEALKLKDENLQKEVESLRLKLLEMEKQLQRRRSWLDYLRLSTLFRQAAAEQQKTA
ncbi:hypothetical protein ACLB2K_023051 [Fragaria x ananassa]